MEGMIALARLHFYQPPQHDKMYNVDVRVENGVYRVIGMWGRRGNAMQQQVKYEGRSMGEAMSTFHGMVDAKACKGYEIVQIDL